MCPKEGRVRLRVGADVHVCACVFVCLEGGVYVCGYFSRTVDCNECNRRGEEGEKRRKCKEIV